MNNDSECAVVPSGDVCAPCSCERDAVALNKRASYLDKRTKLRSQCTGERDDAYCKSAGPCQNLLAACVNQRCILRSATP